MKKWLVGGKRGRKCQLNGDGGDSNMSRPVAPEYSPRLSWGIVFGKCRSIPGAGATRMKIQALQRSPGAAVGVLWWWLPVLKNNNKKELKRHQMSLWQAVMLHRGVCCSFEDRNVTVGTVSRWLLCLMRSQ